MTKKFLRDIAVFRTNKSSARRIRKRTSQQKIETITRHRMGREAQMKRNPMRTATNRRWQLGRRSSRTVALVAVAGLAGLLACVVLGIHARAASGKALLGKTNAAPAATPPVDAVPSRPLNPAVAALQASDTQVKLVTLSPRGFEPDEILITQKRFVLAIDNRSQLGEVSIQFLQVTGNPATPLSRLQEWQMARARVNANTVFELPPGDYLLTEVNHANWVCKFTVSSK